MAGKGRAPKLKSERRTRAVPQRGEWIELRQLDAKAKVPDLPEPPTEAGWSNRTTRAWESWWRDPASQMWAGADIDLVEHLAYIHECFVGGKTSVLIEIRHLRENLGLTPKGKQDRRWRVAPPGDVVDLDDERSAAEKMKELRDRAASAEGDA